MARNKIMIDGNDAAADVAYKLSEIIAIYPITPSSGMGEMSDLWAAQGKKNIWGTIPSVTEMQSEGGASGAVHGALQAGALTTTFTASQGLLLMIPNMYKIAGELTPAVFHVSARSLAAQALSIFGDHQDVMQVRQTGFGLMASGSVQEVQDLAAITHRASLESRIPFIHFFDGFRTSHEIQKIEEITDDDLRELINNKTIHAHRDRAMNPDKPVLRGTAQNPDVYFQGRETVNKYYNAAPALVKEAMDKFAEITGREYHLFDYYGASDAKRIVIMMGSGSETVKETVETLTGKQEEKIGVLVVRLYRPFSAEDFIKAIPKTVEKICVLDRTKEPGSTGEPLYLDVVTTISESMASSEKSFDEFPTIIGGRYGLSSKEFTPAMVKSVYDNLKSETPKNHFTIGINDDVTHTSLEFDPSYITEDNEATKCMFYGLGSDGTVGANKNSIKIIGGETDNNAQGYFVYDSKKSGSTTVSHLRFGKNPINATYLIQEADFVGVHLFELMDSFDVLDKLKKGGTFLLNSSYSKDEVWNKLPKRVQKQIIEKDLSFYVIDAATVAKNTGMGARINTVMQTCFFAISGILPKDEAIQKIKDAINKTYSSKGEEIVKKNYNAVDQSLAHLFEVEYSDSVTSEITAPPVVSDKAPDFVKDTLAMIIAGKGDDVAVRQMPVDGTFPTATAKWEKRNVGLEVPVWEADICIQCNKCALACPHAAIRAKLYEKADLEKAPDTFKSIMARGKDPNKMYTIQVAVEDCTGCNLCVEVCPAKDKTQVSRKAINMTPQRPLREPERVNLDFFLDIPEADRTQLKIDSVAGSQFLEPLFEYSGACPGCGETPYVKLVSQLFGDRAIIANATGCSSIYGGNLPTTPWATNKDGRGPTWNNSLFEDNAEFGLGMRLSIDRQKEYASELLMKLKDEVGGELVESIVTASQKTEQEIKDQRERVELLKAKLKESSNQTAKELLTVLDYLVARSVWIMGGDGWAYDIGFGGLDHVFASGKNVNILVLDTEVYSNTGGQQSKATGIGAVAKFAAAGKGMPKKDLGKIAMDYGNVYVAQIAMGANDAQTIKAVMEAEHYDGVSIIIAYSHCIAHGFDMAHGFNHQKLAVDSGYWPIYRFNPENSLAGKNPLKLDCKGPKIPVKDYLYTENRYKMLTKSHPERAKELLEMSQKHVKTVWKQYSHMADMDYSNDTEEETK